MSDATGNVRLTIVWLDLTFPERAKAGFSQNVRRNLIEQNTIFGALTLPVPSGSTVNAGVARSRRDKYGP